MTDKLAPDSVFAPGDDVLMTESGGVTVLMSMDSGQFVELNDSGSAIWELTDGKRDLAAVAEALCERFDVSVEDCRLDVGEFYDRLRDEKLVRPAR